MDTMTLTNALDAMRDRPTATVRMKISDRERIAQIARRTPDGTMVDTITAAVDALELYDDVAARHRSTLRDLDATRRRLDAMRAEYYAYRSAGFVTRLIRVFLPRY